MKFMVELERFGLWWRKQRETYPSVSAEDFTKQEAESLYKQFLKSAIECAKMGRYSCKLANVDNKDFYVLIDAGGSIRLPLDREGKKIRTLDSSLIPAFEKARK
mgnify:CR=1 FL=1